ncbi:MAG: InlB B-repeat-containing protein [Lentisphaeria bacterium]|nr:InlB B-repeat-containing protein [Lentisphaeria bacterium]
MSNLNAAENIFSLTINQQQPGGTAVTQLYAGEFMPGKHYQKTIALPPHAGYKAVLDPNPTTETCIITLNGETSVSYEILDTQTGGESVTALVTYTPVEVPYAINYYQQNVGDNDYSLAGGASRILYGQTGSPVDVNAILDDAHDYEGFTRRPLSFDINNPTLIAGDGSTVINIYYDRNYYILSFAPAGAIDCPNALFMRYGTPIDFDSIDEPVRPGYDFTGWLWEPEGTNETTMPAYNVLCTAQWTRTTDIGKVRYIIWGETNDDVKDEQGNSVITYEYLDTIPRSYDITMTPYASYQDITASDLTFPNHEGYTIVSGDTDVEILVDGSTIVNVYCTLNSYHLILLDRNESTHLLDVYGKWGQNIMNEWIAATQKTGNSKWATKSLGPNDDYPWTFLAIYMPLGDLTFYMGDNGGTQIEINYYKENGSGGYDLITTMPAKTKGFTLNAANHPDFEGFKFTKATLGNGTEVKDGEYYFDPKKSSGTVLNFYYNTATFKLQFYNGGDIVKEYNPVKYQTVLSETAPEMVDYVPGHPADVPSSYMFAGWTLDPETLGELIDLSEYTMPDKNLALYAKWIPPVYNITAYQTSTLQNLVYSDQITWGDSIVDELPTPDSPEMQEGMEGYNFVNWFYKDKNGVEYVFDATQMVVKSDLVLYGKWQTDTYVNYEVRFEDAAGNTLAEPVQDIALGGSNITVVAKSIPTWFPSVHSTSLFIDLDETKNVYTFIYRQPPVVPYTVRYLDRKNNEPLRNDKIVNDNTKDVVTERFEPIVKYVVDEPFKMLYLVATSDNPSADENVLVFYYDRNDTQVAVTADCFVNQDLSGNPANANYVLVPTLSRAEYVLFNPDETTTYTLGDIPAIEHYTLNSSKSTSATQTLTEVGIAYELYYEPTVFTVTYSTGVDGCEPWQITRVLEGDSTPSYDGDTTYPVTELQDDYIFSGFDKEIATKVTENTTYTAQWDGIFHVHHCTADGSDVPQEDIRISQLDGNDFDITAKLFGVDGKEIYNGIPSGYLYGGLWSDATGSALREDVCGVELQPKTGDHYYVREISDGYLTPRTLTVRIKGVYSCALVSAIDDPANYIGFGFDAEAVSWTSTTAFEKLVVKYADPKKADSEYTADDVFKGLSGKMICNDAPEGEGEQKLSFTPFYATKDSVKVFGKKTRSLAYSSSASSTVADSDSGLPCVKYAAKMGDYAADDDDETMRLSMILAPSFVLGGGDEGTSVNVTINIGDLCTTVPVPSGADLSDGVTNPSVEGCVFAGWFRDEACTRPASLSCVAEDMEIYAGFLGGGYLKVAELPAANGSDAVRVRLVSAVDTVLASECGFVVTDVNGTREIQASDFYGSVDGYTAEELFGDTDGFASLMCLDLVLAGVEGEGGVTVTPYWKPLCGARVLGEAKRVMVNGK